MSPACLPGVLEVISEPDRSPQTSLLGWMMTMVELHSTLRPQDCLLPLFTVLFTKFRLHGYWFMCKSRHLQCSCPRPSSDFRFGGHQGWCYELSLPQEMGSSCHQEHAGISMTYVSVPSMRPTVASGQRTLSDCSCQQSSLEMKCDLNLSWCVCCFPVGVWLLCLI